MKTDAQLIADAILRELDKSTYGMVDLDKVPEFSKYKQKLPMHKYGWLRRWSNEFTPQLLEEANKRNICFETGKVMGKKEARGFAMTENDEIRRIFVIAKKC